MSGCGSRRARHTRPPGRLSYLEETACVTRRGRNGVVREWGSGFVASAFAHRTSRALDPHLHTHVIVANMAQSPDGNWRALDGDLLLGTHRLAAGSLYQAQLRYELTTRLGVDWQPVVKGMAEIRGVPDVVLGAFSTRRAQVVAHLAEHATQGWRAAQKARASCAIRRMRTSLLRPSSAARRRSSRATASTTARQSSSSSASPLAFPSANGHLIDLHNWRGREWKPALEAAGIRHGTIYTLRHTFATNAIAAGIGLFELARYMGTSVEMLDRV